MKYKAFPAISDRTGNRVWEIRRRFLFWWISCFTYYIPDNEEEVAETLKFLNGKPV